MLNWRSRMIRSPPFHNAIRAHPASEVPAVLLQESLPSNRSSTHHRLPPAQA